MFGKILENNFAIGFIVFISSFLISFLFIPLVWKFSTKKGLIAVPNHRSSHIEQVPNTGGILLFFSITIPLLIFSDLQINRNSTFIIISFLSLFMVGVLDDLINVTVRFKFFGQFVPAVFLILSLYNQELVLPFISWSHEIPGGVKFVFWIFAVVGIINAYNFIDGIDGLAIGMGSLSGLLFGVYFISAGYMNLSALGFALTGGLLGLLKWNLKKEKKIFIGDTGSLVIGGIVSLFILRHLEINAYDDLNFSSSMVFGILFIPVSDLIRVVLNRVVNRKSPFQADRTHIHHILMDSLLLDHRKTSLMIVFSQLLIFFVFLGFNKIFQKGQLIFSLFMFLAYYIIITRIGKKEVSSPAR